MQIEKQKTKEEIKKLSKTQTTHALIHFRRKNQLNAWFDPPAAQALQKGTINTKLKNEEQKMSKNQTKISF